MKFKKVIASTLSAFIVLGMLAGCGSTNSPSASSSATPSPSNTTSATPAATNQATPTPAASNSDMDEEQILNMIFLTPLTLDVNDARNSSEFQIMTHVFEGLTRVYSDENGIDNI